ncbi:MAG: V-type ATP synthase subunit A [Wenzhouxiangellaceae bacterium]|nr:V-type ATP synthase subunit A [Wenzhouxiangellaceae bacterium]
MSLASESRTGEALATIVEIAGPVVRARAEGSFRTNEAVAVGEARLIGEVLRLSGDEITVQVFEETTGLRPGNRVFGSGQPLSVDLGPGLLGGIFDGLLRPLTGTGDAFIHPGLFHSPAGRHEFEPVVAKGDEIAGGAAFGKVPGHGRFDLALPVPPDVSGTVDEIVEAGEYAADETVCKVRRDDEVTALTMRQRWPVRSPRPIRRRLESREPLITGQRILDSLFPVARGGRAAMPGGFGTGKTVLQQAVAKWCDADVIVYVGCGERGNEMAEVLREFPELEDPRTGRPLSERSVIIANTSNMPVAAREASIYTGVTVAEYFRDMGFDVAMLADSTSRWAEALREISGRLGELPAEAGYPAYLGSRKAEFYERAGRVETLSGQKGSVTLIGAVSPPGGDFSEPVTLYTQRNVRCFWPLDRDRARARFYPAIHPLQAYSEDAGDLGRWWREQGYPEWERHRRRLLELLEDQVHLERMARIVGKDTLPAPQRLALLNAELANDAFLRQSAMSETDAYCAPKRQVAMLRVLMRFIDGAERALSDGADIDEISALPVLRRIRRMGEEIGNDEVERFEKLAAEIDSALAGLAGTDSNGRSHGDAATHSSGSSRPGGRSYDESPPKGA